ncbi:MAG: hypothetical protein JO056_08665 [Alphaproteobacteria bacterium]|nr:hypothetical protein [Alphaproteobacteria bacterium]
MTNLDGSNGSIPVGGTPALDNEGNVFLPVRHGGLNNMGTVVRVSPRHPTKVIHTFDGKDGNSPQGGLLYDSSTGTFFGTTTAGGLEDCDCGVLYSIDSSGKETVLHRFDGVQDGSFPVDAPSRDHRGNLYGVARYGGAGGQDSGTVWKRAFKGGFKILHAFSGGDGANPAAGLLDGKKGLFYGTTVSGGAHNAGTVFSISTGGTFTTLHSFDAESDGASPYATPIQDKLGNLYGTAVAGGPGGGGTIYKLAPDGTFTVIHAFSNDLNGDFPQTSLVLVKGKLYGTTDYYGDPSCGCGTVFEAGMDGTLNVLHTFTGKPDGFYPFSGLTRGPNGYLYGDTELGGTGDQGTIYRIKR